MATPYITAYSVSTQSVRSDFDGNLGFLFTVGGASIVISQLGRWKISGNSQTHTVYILDSGGNVVVSATVNLSGGVAGSFVYAAITDTTLSASTNYYCMSSESNGGDQWYDPNGTGTFGTYDTTYVTGNRGAYQTGGSGAPALAWTDPYVPPNFMIGAGGGGGGGSTSHDLPLLGVGKGMLPLWPAWWRYQRMQEKRIRQAERDCLRRHAA